MEWVVVRQSGNWFVSFETITFGIGYTGPDFITFLQNVSTDTQVDCTESFSASNSYASGDIGTCPANPGVISGASGSVVVSS